MKKITTLLSIITFGSILTLIVAGFMSDQEDLGIEVFKATLNLLTVVLVTQIITISILLYSQNVNRLEAQDAFIISSLDQLHDCFFDLKKTRRQIRAYSQNKESSGRVLSKKRYHESMEVINQIQLTLESIAKSIETNSDEITKSKEIFLNLSEMEDYLNKIVDEWEHKEITALPKDKFIQLDDLNALSDLIKDYKGSKFRTEFIHKYYHTITLFRQSISTGRSKLWKKFLNRSNTHLFR